MSMMENLPSTSVDQDEPLSLFSVFRRRQIFFGRLNPKVGNPSVQSLSYTTCDVCPHVCSTIQGHKLHVHFSRAVEVHPFYEETVLKSTAAYGSHPIVLKPTAAYTISLPYVWRKLAFEPLVSRRHMYFRLVLISRAHEALSKQRRVLFRRRTIRIQSFFSPQASRFETLFDCSGVRLLRSNADKHTITIYIQRRDNNYCCHHRTQAQAKL